jgi:hypothetical protein
MNAVAAVKTWFGFGTAQQEQKTTKGEMPKGTEAIRDKFLSRPDKPDEKLTPIQERMQSGDR